MLIHGMAAFKLPENQEAEFKRIVFVENLRRGRKLAAFIIGLEVILQISNITACLLKADNRFRFAAYFVLYLMMILASVPVYILLKKKANIKFRGNVSPTKLNRVLFFYAMFVMAWGAAVSLVDQALYGQLMTFMVNVIICSVVFYFDFRREILATFPAVLILYVGLPFFQPSSDVLVGHYVNSTIFILISLICSQILYKSFYDNFCNRQLLKTANAKFRKLSLFDELTGIPNRRSFDRYISRSSEFSKEQAPLSVIMIDIDYFKLYNDTYGHNAGDVALTKVARKIESSIRSTTDFVARIGGEEFIVIARETGAEDSVRLAERIRNAVAMMAITFDSPCSHVLTISLGTSTIAEGTGEKLDEYIALADQALYQAKGSGRNCVRSALPSVQ